MAHVSTIFKPATTWCTFFVILSPLDDVAKTNDLMRAMFSNLHEISNALTH